MDFRQLLKVRRSIRLFRQRPVSDEALKELIFAASQAACARNAQRLRYVVVRTPETLKAVFDCCAWGAAVRPRRTPVWGESAPATIIAVTAASETDTAHLEADAGAAIQSMMFAAADQGLGSCWLGAVDREKVTQILGVFPVLYLLAVGIPAESPVAETVFPGGAVNYFLDGENRLHVPKKSTEELTQWR